jgi:5-(carboxyamino)imidazole ribonucleotide mutase
VRFFHCSGGVCDPTARSGRFEFAFLQEISSGKDMDRNMTKKVGIIMGSDSDLPIVQKAIDTLKSLDIPCEAHIYSAHRTPEEAGRFAREARENGFGILIAAAGMAAHLAGAIAAQTTLPVIGIPCKSTNLDGIDALLSTVQMPSGIPVATVAINGGVNAALLAAEILAVTDADLAAKLDAKRASDKAKVLEKDAALQAQLNG